MPLSATRDILSPLAFDSRATDENDDTYNLACQLKANRRGVIAS